MKRWTVRRSLAVIALALLLAGCARPGEPRYQGWVEAELLFIGPDEAGRIEKLSVREGDVLSAGSPIFAVDEQLQQSDVQAASAAVAEARARLARLEHAQQRKEEVAVLLAQERRAESALALSSLELERQKTLTAKGIAAKAQLDTANANYDRDHAQLEEVRRQIDVARMASREEDIAAARESLAAAQARKVSAETRLTRRRVVSPVEGTVQQVYFRPGELVSAGRPVIAMLPPQNLKVRFFVPEAALPAIAVGNGVRIYCDGCAQPIPAKVSFVARMAEFTPPVIYSLEERSKLVFLVEARTEHPERLRVGQPVSVALDAAAVVSRVP